MEDQIRPQQSNYQNTPPASPKPEGKRFSWPVFVLAALLLVAGAAFMGYQYQKSQSDATEARLNTRITELQNQIDLLNKTTVEKKTETPTNEAMSSVPSSVVNIKDLGLNVTVPGELADLTSEVTRLTGDQAVNSVVLSSKKAELAGCTRSSGPLGYLTYNSDKGGTMVASARGSNVYYLAPTNTCSAVTANDLAKLKEALKSLVTDNSR